MKWTDTFRMAMHNLWQRRGRAALSLLGIVLGCIILLMADAGTRGVGRAIQMLFESSDFVRQIRIVVDQQAEMEVPESAIAVDGQMSDDRRQRIQDVLEADWLREQRTRSKRQINMQTLRALERLPHVVEVRAGNAFPSVATFGQQETDAPLSEIDGEGNITERIVAGQTLDAGSESGILIDDILAWRLGFINDADLPKLIGQSIEVSIPPAGSGRGNSDDPLSQLAGLAGLSLPSGIEGQGEMMDAVRALVNDVESTSLTEQQKQMIRGLAGFLRDRGGRSDVDDSRDSLWRSFEIQGVYRTESSSDFADFFRSGGSQRGLLIAPEVARRLREQREPNVEFNSASITVEDHTHLASTVGRLEADGYRCISALRILERIDHALDRIRRVLFVLAMIILVITCIGICNTQFVSILERTPEIGVLKSLGADDSHILRLMLCEGAVLGAIGGVISIPLSVLCGRIGDRVLRGYAERRMRGGLNDGLFDFEWTSAGIIILVSAVLCVLAGLVPAIRASRLDPVDAMRRR